jgi:hypothetical protein
VGDLSDSEFGRFATARWPDLVRTAYLVSGDEGTAVRLSVAALAGLSRRWTQVADDGSPTAAARSDLVARLLQDDAASDGQPTADLGARLRRGLGGSARGGRGGLVAPLTARPAPASPWAAAEPDPAPGPVGTAPGADPWTSTTAALWDAFRRAPTLARVVHALGVVEGLDADEAGRAAERPPAAVSAAMAAADDQLSRAHAAERRRVGLEPAERAVRPELHEALQHRLTRLSPPVDPLPLVRAHRRARRRRGQLVGAAVAAVCATVVAVTGATALSGRAGPSTPTSTVAADAWTSIATWPARGELTHDEGIERVVDRVWGYGARIVYAGDVGSSRFVVAWVPANGGPADGVDGGPGVDPSMPALGIMTGPAHVALDGSTTRTAGDSGVTPAVTVRASGRPGSTDLLVLAQPTLTQARLSAHVTFAADGRADRSWRTLDLVDGVGRTSLPGDRLVALRVSVGRFDGPPLGSIWDADAPLNARCSPCSTAQWAGNVASGARARLAQATGIPVDEIGQKVLFDGTIGGRASRQHPLSRAGRQLRADATVIRYDLPGGAQLKVSAARFAGSDSHRDEVYDLFVPMNGAPGRQPLVAMAPDPAGDTSRHVGVVVPGAARLQIRCVFPEVPPGPVTSTPSGAALLTLPDPNVDPQAYQVTAWDSHGHPMGTWDLFLQNVFDPMDMWS